MSSGHNMSNPALPDVEWINSFNEINFLGLGLGGLLSVYFAPDLIGPGVRPIGRFPASCMFVLEELNL